MIHGQVDTRSTYRRGLKVWLLYLHVSTRNLHFTEEVATSSSYKRAARFVLHELHLRIKTRIWECRRHAKISQNFKQLECCEGEIASKACMRSQVQLQVHPFETSRRSHWCQWHHNKNAICNTCNAVHHEIVFRFGSRTLWWGRDWLCWMHADHHWRVGWCIHTWPSITFINFEWHVLFSLTILTYFHWAPLHYQFR